MAHMDARGNLRTLEGLPRYCPVPASAVDVGVLARWRHLRDGMRLITEMLPVEERVLAARMQEHWAYCCFQVEKYEAMEVPAWVLPLES